MKNLERIDQIKTMIYPDCSRCKAIIGDTIDLKTAIFLIRAFEVMRSLAAENYYDNWKYGDESKERKEAFLITDQAFEEKMADIRKNDLI